MAGSVETAPERSALEKGGLKSGLAPPAGAVALQEWMVADRITNRQAADLLEMHPKTFNQMATGIIETPRYVLLAVAAIRAGVG